MNRFRLAPRLTLLITLLIGLGLAASAHALPDRKGRQNLKKKYDVKGVAGDFFKNANPVNAGVQKLLSEDPKDKNHKENVEKNAKLKTELLKDIRAALGKLHAVIKKL